MSKNLRQLAFMSIWALKHKRTDMDEEGNPYPLLYMKRNDERV